MTAVEPSEVTIAQSAPRRRVRHPDPARRGIEDDDVLLHERTERLPVVDLRRLAGLGERPEDLTAELELAFGQAASRSISGV